MSLSPRKRGSFRGDFEPDSPCEGDFSAIPHSQLVACCLWEYARESPTIQLWSNLNWCNVRNIVHRDEYQKDPALEVAHNKCAEAVFARAKRARFNRETFSKRLWSTDFPFLEIFEAVTYRILDGSVAWQRLPSKERMFLCRIVDESAMIQPLQAAFVGELEELWNANSADLLEARSEVDTADDDSEEALRWGTTVPVQPFANDPGAFRDRIVAAFTVDFSRFTDREITREFSTWLARNRPKKWKTPRRIFLGARQKGRKLLEYQVALERLGLMRLLHWHTPSELRESRPDAWKRIRHKERCFRREVRAATAFFRKLFPFLPPSERLHHEERKGIWLRPMRQICEQVEREMKGRTKNH